MKTVSKELLTSKRMKMVQRNANNVDKYIV